MLAVFCLRLALGMLFALFFLSPSKMHPRFFRTHFVTVLGLFVVAFRTSWPSDSESEPAAGSAVTNQERGSSPFSPELWPWMIPCVLLIVMGAVIWLFEKPTGGRTLQAFSCAAIGLALGRFQLLTALTG